MKFWKSKINTDESKANKTLHNIKIMGSGDRLVVRFGFADTSFTDIDVERIPNFRLGENLEIYMQEDVVVPTRETETKTIKHCNDYDQ